ncbi:hypothetical protein [Massilia cavernae]|uniref:Uncharacterized protein n=1 Tax=Massilia cavernae TaxID=2320864 RepID=A0A418XPS7_9BURK|nr:hypothetical protein [Massilia cavernae]RJG14437.1 hypothetical protein D3872_17755 [Massilia cavernae]
MPSTVRHRSVNIVFLEEGEAILTHCKPGDIAIEHRPDGWWTSFIGEKGEADSYDQPYASYNEALWAAKAAAEFGLR